MFTDTVVDLSHWNTIPDMPTIKADGVLGIIHKATNGADGIDPSYSARRDLALAAGLLWGAYHFGTGDDPMAQEANFSRVFQNMPESGKGQLVALDWESNRGYGTSMTVAQAEWFVQRLHDRLGRWPVLYSGKWWLDVALPRGYSGTLLNCPLWVASYTDSPLIPQGWNAWTFWQHSDGSLDVGLPPYGYAHLKGCDMDRFNGSSDDLIAWWGK